MNKYIYDGSVLEFDRIVAEHWKATTYAETESKARSNLAYQFKRQYGKVPRTKVKVPGKLIIAEGVEKNHE